MTLQLWDTAGQERFRAITQAYYRSAHCLILVYDISAASSFETLAQWCRDIDQHTGGSTQVYRALVGNKCDKDREIEYETGEQFARANGFDLFMETSALHSDNVDQLFTHIATVLADRRKSTLPTNADSLSLASHKSAAPSRKGAGGCCGV